MTLQLFFLYPPHCAPSGDDRSISTRVVCVAPTENIYSHRKIAIHGETVRFFFFLNSRIRSFQSDGTLTQPYRMGYNGVATAEDGTGATRPGDVRDLLGLVPGSLTATTRDTEVAYTAGPAGMFDLRRRRLRRPTRTKCNVDPKCRLSAAYSAWHNNNSYVALRCFEPGPIAT